MKLFNRVFNKNPTTTRFQLITDSGNGFFMWDGKLYHSDVIRSCIRPKVKALGKLVAKHIRDTNEGLKVNPDVYIRLLLEEPNPYMTGQMLIEKMANQLALNHNAFAYICRDDNGYATDIYPIPCEAVEAIYDNQAMLWLKFTLKNGKTATWPYSDIIHLREDFNDNEIFGTRPDEALKSLMEIITTTDQGIVKAIRNSSAVKWLLKFTSTLRPEDMEKATKDFVDNYLSIDSKVGGAAAADARYDAKQVEPKDYVPNASQTDRTITRIYNFFHTNEKIIQAKYTEDEWISYFESEIEPIAIQLSNEYTRKIFSRRERGFGNKIIFEASNLQYASLSTKLQLVQMVDRGALTPNEWRATLNLTPIVGGDVPVRRLDTAVVK